MIVIYYINFVAGNYVSTKSLKPGRPGGCPDANGVLQRVWLQTVQVYLSSVVIRFYSPRGLHSGLQKHHHAFVSPPNILVLVCLGKLRRFVFPGSTTRISFVPHITVARTLTTLERFSSPPSVPFRACQKTNLNLFTTAPKNAKHENQKEWYNFLWKIIM